MALSLGALERVAWAEGDASHEQRQVLLVVAADPGEAQRLGQVAAELLGRLSVRVRTRRVERIDVGEIAGPMPPLPAYLARLFVDLREPTQATLWIVDPVHDRILVRRLPRAPGSEELAREELGHILETGLPRAEVMPMLTEPGTRRPPARPPRPASTPRQWQIALLYELLALEGPSRIVHGPEASLFFRAPPRAAAVGLWITAQYRLPLHVDALPVGARLEGGALRAMITLDVLAHTKVNLRLALGGGIDLVELEPEASGASGVSLAESRLLSFGVARAAVGVELRVSSWMTLWARAAADVDPSGTRYVFERHDGEQLVLKPWPVRPGLAIGAGVP